MKRQLLIACFAVLAAAPASALRTGDWLGLQTEERRCADPKRGPDEMLRQCSEALARETNPKARLALLTDLGIAYAQAGRINPAMDCFTQILNIDPDDWRALTLRADGYMRLKRPKEAAADAEHVLRLKPDFAYAHLLHGRALAAQDLYDAALSEIDAGIARAPDSPTGYNTRGNVHASMGRPALAVADFDKAIALEPQGGYYNNRCFERAKPEVGDLAGALADCNKAMETDTSADVFDSRGFVYFRMGDYPRAAADYAAALDKKPAFASSLFMRGAIKRRQGDAKGGDADIAAAKALDADVAATYAKYGVTP